MLRFLTLNFWDFSSLNLILLSWLISMMGCELSFAWFLVIPCINYRVSHQTFSLSNDTFYLSNSLTRTNYASAIHPHTKHKEGCYDPAHWIVFVTAVKILKIILKKPALQYALKMPKVCFNSVHIDPVI